jgi:hypothetical protein
MRSLYLNVSLLLLLRNFWLSHTSSIATSPELDLIAPFHHTATISCANTHLMLVFFKLICLIQQGIHPGLLHICHSNYCLDAVPGVSIYVPVPVPVTASLANEGHRKAWQVRVPF